MNDEDTQASTESTIDPVCGMTVQPDERTPSFAFDGRRFFFCSDHCLEQFKSDPHRYVHKLSAAEAGAASTAPGEIEYTCPMHPQIVRNAPGTCPICGMALEPRIGAGEQENAELADMTRRFWIAVALTVPEVALAMLPARFIGAILGHESRMLAEVALTTPVVIWAGWP